MFDTNKVTLVVDTKNLVFDTKTNNTVFDTNKPAFDAKNHVLGINKKTALKF